ncbi:unnamed protein product [Malus baccata var. baccata]
MLTHCDVPFGFLIFKSILSKSKHARTYQRGSTIHPCLITQLYELDGVKKCSDDLCLKTTKDLHRNMMNLNNVMCVIAQGDPGPVSSSTASQDRKIAYLESEVNSFRKQFVDYNQTSLNPLSFVPEPSLRPPKLVPHRHVDPSSVSYHTAVFSDHSSFIAAKMAAIYAAKGNEVSINVYQHFSSTPTSKDKHIRFTYSSDEDENKEGLGHDPCPEDVPVEYSITVGSPVGLEDLSQSDDFKSTVRVVRYGIPNQNPCPDFQTEIFGNPNFSTDPKPIFQESQFSGILK